MITVRFPTGVSVQYNDANYACRYADGYTDLYTKQDGALIAQVPTAGCAIEWRAPCRVYRAADRRAEYGERLERIERELRSLKRRIPARPK